MPVSCCGLPALLRGVLFRLRGRVNECTALAATAGNAACRAARLSLDRFLANMFSRTVSALHVMTSCQQCQIISLRHRINSNRAGLGKTLPSFRMSTGLPFASSLWTIDLPICSLPDTNTPCPFQLLRPCGQRQEERPTTSMMPSENVFSWDHKYPSYALCRKHPYRFLNRMLRGLNLISSDSYTSITFRLK